MSEKQSQRDTITNLFKSFSGQAGSLVIPRPYIDFCGGDHLAALLLSQILYWADRTEDPDGWFVKSYAEWESELAMTKYQVNRALNGDKRSKKGHKGLKAVGVETELRRSKYHKGAATLHYRINAKALRQAILEYLGISVVNNVDIGEVNNVNNDAVNNVANVVVNNVANVNKDSTKTNKESSANGAKKPAKPPKRPAEKLNPIKDAIVTAFGWSWETMTKTEAGRVQKAAADLFDAGVEPEFVPKLYAHCKKNFDMFSPNALCNVVSDVRKQAPKKVSGGILDMSDIDESDPDYYRIWRERMEALNRKTS